MNDRQQAESEGFTVDTHCYPWFAYKGPRFRPDESKSIRTDLECSVQQDRGADRQVQTLADELAEYVRQGDLGASAPLPLEFVGRLDDALRSRTPSAADECAWLIEKDDPPVYHLLTDDFDEHWTPDASKALRFARREDAQAYVDHTGWTSPPVRVVEHMWCGPRSSAPDVALREAFSKFVAATRQYLAEAKRRLDADIPKDAPVHPVSAYLTGLAIEIGDAEYALSALEAKAGEPRTVIFGRGWYGVDIGTLGGEPAVFIIPNEIAGLVGEKIPRDLQGPLEREKMPADWTALIFPTRERCKEVADALVGSRMDKWKDDPVEPTPAVDREAVARRVANRLFLSNEFQIAHRNVASRQDAANDLSEAILSLLAPTALAQQGV